MTVDMLTAALIWPEDMLVGRTAIAEDREPGVADDLAPAPEPPAEPDALPFWAALVRRLRANPVSPGIEAR